MSPNARLLLKQESGRIELVQPLHDDNDCAPGGVVEPAAQGGVNPGVRRGALGIAHRLIRADRVVEDGGVAAAAHRGRADGGRNHLPAPVVGVLRDLIAVAGKLEAVAKKPLKPGRLQQRAALDLAFKQFGS